MSLKPLLLLVLAGFALPVLAVEPGAKIDSQLEACQHQAQTTLDSQNCYLVATRGWDAELNKQYQALLNGTPEAVGSALRDSQRQWLKYKNDYDAAINLFYQQQQGTIWGIIAAQSKMNVIKDKALDLYRLRTSTQLGE